MSSLCGAATCKAHGISEKHPDQPRNTALQKTHGSRETFKNPRQERRLFAVRALAAAFGTSLLLALIAGHMAFLQIVNHDHFKTLSQENRVKLVAQPPPRGLIYDRNGVVLAENRPSYQLEITP
jgi:penicillin-binding protein 2